MQSFLINHRRQHQHSIARHCGFLLSILLTLVTSTAHAEFPGSFNWVTGLDRTVPPAAGPVPGLNQRFIDPVHGTTIQRITEDANSWHRHEYSRRPAFNANDTRIIMRSSGGYWHLYRVNGDAIQYVQGLPVMSEPNWHPTDPNRFRYLINEGDDMRIHEYNITTQRTRVAVDFRGRLPWANASRVWTEWEGRPSDDGRVWCLIAEDRNLNTVGIFSYDMDRDRILGSLSLNVDINHISTSPTGRYCIPGGSSPYGVRAYTVDFSRNTRMHTASEHSDTALDGAGRDVLVLANFSSGYIEMVDMGTGRNTQLLPLYERRGSKYSVHISGIATDTPGYAVVSTYNTHLDYGASDANYGDIWGQDRLAIVELKPDPEVYNVAYMRNRFAGYWSEPHATVNRDLTRIIFASNWGTQTDEATRSYMVTLDTEIDEAQLMRQIERKMPSLRIHLQRTPGVAFRQRADKARLARRYRALAVALNRNQMANARRHANAFSVRVNGCGARPDANDYVTTCTHQRRLARNLQPITSALNQLVRARTIAPQNLSAANGESN